jgi:cell division protein FtsA
MTSKADMEITDADVKNVLEVAENEIPQASIINKKIIHSIPVSYKIDGQTIMGRPNNMRGNKLEVKALFVVCIEQHLDDLIKAVEKTGVDVWDIMASPIAGSLVTLNKNQKTAGCVLANIGSETVSIVVFENNTPISLEIFPIGGTDITNDIALGLRISLNEAEQIKVSSVEPNFSKKKLEEIIMARLSDIFELIEAHLKKIGRNGLLPAGIILTGGGSGIGSIEDMAKLSLKLPSRIASVNFISNSKNTQIKDSSWSVAYGLATWGLNNIGDIPEGVRIPSNAGNKIIEWFKRSIQQFLP